MALLSLLACAAVQAQAAEAAPSARLSDRGRQMVEGALGGSWSNESEPGFFNRTPVWSVYAQPSWVLFVRDRIGLGVYAGYQVRRPSTGLDPETAMQAPQNLSGQPVPRFWIAPIEHDFSAGFSAAFELVLSGRLSLFVRPYLGMALRRREVNRLFWSPGAANGIALGQVTRLDWQSQVGMRLPLVVQVSSHVGLGFGPDFLWENLAGNLNSVRFGFTSWIARSF
jgi:hypothetical protein